MLSPADIAVVGVFALLVFGPDQLPKVARRAGQIMREVQNTSQTFIREMERAADDMDLKAAFAHEPEHAMSGPKPASEKFDEPSPRLVDRDPHRAAADAAKTPGTQSAAVSENGVPKDAAAEPDRDGAHEDASGI